MTLRISIVTLLAGVLLLLLAGCYGTTASLNPTVTIQVPEGTTLPNWPSGTVLPLSATATVTDTTNNPITSFQWTQDPAGAGQFLTTDSPDTSWTPPVVAPGGANVPVTLTLTVTTLQGGKASSKLNIIVTPPAP